MESLLEPLHDFEVVFSTSESLVTVSFSRVPPADILDLLGDLLSHGESDWGYEEWRLLQ